jgi:hypothetical protein
MDAWMCWPALRKISASGTGSCFLQAQQRVSCSAAPSRCVVRICIDAWAAGALTGPRQRVPGSFVLTW